MDARLGEELLQPLQDGVRCLAGEQEKRRARACWPRSRYPGWYALYRVCKTPLYTLHRVSDAPLYTSIRRFHVRYIDGQTPLYALYRASNAMSRLHRVS